MFNIKNWLQCMFTPYDTHYRIICFPHAGGTAAFFKSWGPQMINCEVFSVRYPGRAERLDEPLSESIPELAYEIGAIVEQLADKPLIFFGHSMGAVVALETARALEQRNLKIKHLFASGSRNGPLPPSTPYIQESDDTICEHLVKMGGTNAEMSADPIFRELILPSVRGDGKIFHAYKMDLKPQLICPITTIYGDIDVDADIRPWQDLTTMSFNEICVSGDHFYLIKDPPFSIIQDNLNINKIVYS